jgi:hypothetical protein
MLQRYLFYWLVLYFISIYFKTRKMKNLLFLFITGVLAACGGNEGTDAVGDSQSMKIDTLSHGSNMATMPVDTTGASKMNADTSGMSNAR